MAATAQAQAEATKASQRVGSEHAKPNAERAYLGRKPSASRAWIIASTKKRVVFGPRFADQLPPLGLDKSGQIIQTANHGFQIKVAITIRTPDLCLRRATVLLVANGSCDCGVDDVGLQASTSASELAAGDLNRVADIGGT